MLRRIGRSVPMAAVTIVASLAVLLALAGEAPSAPTFYQIEQDEYVGSDLCQECHTAESDTFATSIHAELDWSEIEWPHEYEEGIDIACEACHGPGLTHVEMAGTEEPGFRQAILSFANVSASEGSGQCLTCHAENDNQAHYFGGMHDNQDVGCADCHNPHQSIAVYAALETSEPELCYECHGDQRGMFALPERHPVNQGLMTCSDCHSPHGTSNRLQLVAAGNETCTDCHQEKRGPFVFPHPAAETDGCTACHQPHGSVNLHMLNFREPALNCLQCHTGQPGFHTQPGFSECTACHLTIHGSNLDPHFLR